MLENISKKQKTFRTSGPFQIPKYERRQFVANSRQSINFVFSRKLNLVRKRVRLAPYCAGKAFIHPTLLHGDVRWKKGRWKHCHPEGEAPKGKAPIHQPVVLPNLSERMKDWR